MVRLHSAAAKDVKMLAKFFASCLVLGDAVVFETLVTSLWLHWRLSSPTTVPVPRFS